MRSTSVFLLRWCYGFAARAIAWQRARLRLRASPGCLLKMHRRNCGARAPTVATGVADELRRERGAASALHPGWRDAPRDDATMLEARRFAVGLGCHWATKC
jgi:hypothetical protein